MGKKKAGFTDVPEQQAGLEEEGWKRWASPRGGWGGCFPWGEVSGDPGWGKGNSVCGITRYIRIQPVSGNRTTL